MKKLFFIIGIVLAMSSLFVEANAQNVSVNVSVNINKQPAWGPSGYDYAGYYYFPDLNIYFDVNDALYYILSGGNWVSSRYLPDAYRKYDLYSLYKIVLNDPKPWLQNKNHKKLYKEYKNDRTQIPIRFSNDARYEASRKNNQPWVDTSNRSANRNNNSSQKNDKNNVGNKVNAPSQVQGSNSHGGNRQNENKGKK